MSEKFISEKVVSVYENDNLRSATVNAIDALDGEIDAVWGLIATSRFWIVKAATTVMQAALCALLIIT